MAKRPVSPQVGRLRRRLEKKASAHDRSPKVDSAAGTTRVRLHAKRTLSWAAVAVATAIIGTLVTANATSLKEWLSQNNPVSGIVTDSKTPPDSGSGFSMLVADPASLPSNIGQVKDCRDLWREGSKAKGVLTQDRPQLADLRGLSETGATIVALRARVTKRLPAADGVLLECPAAGAQEPSQFTFEIGNNDVVDASRQAPAGDSSAASQFGDGFRIELKKNETAALALKTSTPNDAIFWHYELDVRTEDSVKTVVLDDHGRDFYSPGSRPSNDYVQGHAAGVDTSNWGVENTSRIEEDSNGIKRLRFGRLSVPFEPGLDFYRPRQEAGDTGPTSPLWVRQNGRKLLSVNIPGSPQGVLPEPYDLCGGNNGIDDIAPIGYVKQKEIVSASWRTVDGQLTQPAVVEYVCSLGVGVPRASDSGPGFFSCLETPCVEQAAQVNLVRFPVEGVGFISWSNEVPVEDVQTATQLLSGARVEPG